MVLGFSGVGKTFYLGSLFKLRFDIGPQGIALQDEDFTSETHLGKAYDSMVVRESGVIPSTMGLIDSSMLLTKGLDKILEIAITDVEGQALDPKKSSDTSQKLINEIDEYDGLILIVKAPKNLQEAEKSKAELGQMLSFAREALQGNERIPMTLVLNQVDLLPELQGVRPRIEEELGRLEEELERKYRNNYSLIEQQLRVKKGEIINKFVKPAINTRAMFQVRDTFFKFIRATKFAVPNRVFPCTSFGFVNESSSLELATYLAETGQIYEPYGGAASFLWTLYARLKSLPKVRLMEMVSNEFGDLPDNLLEDIRDLHMSGRAYFDPEGDSASRNDIWSLRNLSSLESHTLEV